MICQGHSRHKSSRQKAALRFIPRSLDSVPAPLADPRLSGTWIIRNYLTDIDGNEDEGRSLLEVLTSISKKEELVASFP